MKVMGIDPGSVCMGLGCIESQDRSLMYVGHRLVNVKMKKESSWVERIRIIYSSVQEQIKLWQPDCVAIENVFMSQNASSALKLGQARGSAIAAVAMANLPLHEYSPRSIKQSVASYGNANKQQVASMVALLLGNSLKQHSLQADVSDALATAICHTQHQRLYCQQDAR